MVIDKIISAEEILSIVADCMGITVDEIKSRRRYRYMVDARKIAAHMMRSYTNLTLSSMAIKLGMSEDRHDTVLYYIGDVMNISSQDERISKYIEAIDNRIVKYISSGFSIDNVDVSSDLITSDKFVHIIMDSINWEEKGTTRDALSVMYYNIFVKKQFNNN